MSLRYRLAVLFEDAMHNFDFDRPSSYADRAIAAVLEHATSDDAISSAEEAGEVRDQYRNLVSFDTRRAIHAAIGSP